MRWHLHFGAITAVEVDTTQAIQVPAMRSYLNQQRRIVRLLFSKPSVQMTSAI